MEAKLFRRYLSMLLTLLLVFSLLPTAAFAALITTGTEPDPESEPTTTVDINVIVAVSYTHLDVYKRQIYTWTNLTRR